MAECTGYTQKNGAVLKVNKKFISHLTGAQPTLLAAATVQVVQALPAVRFSGLLQGRGASFQDGVATGKGFLCAPFWGEQKCFVCHVTQGAHTEGLWFSCVNHNPSMCAPWVTRHTKHFCSPQNGARNKPFPAATPSWKLAPRPRSKRDKRTVGSASETWTVAAADGVRCACVRWEIHFLLTFETAPFFCVYPVY